MRKLNTLISLAIVAGLGYSQCSGGLFAIPSALAKSFASDSGLAATKTDKEGETVLMSTDPNICLVTVEHELDDSHVEKQHGGCEDGSSCLELARLKIMQSASLKEVGGIAQEILPSAITLAFATETSRGVSERFARAGPLYAMAEINAHILLKRE